MVQALEMGIVGLVKFIFFNHHHHVVTTLSSPAALLFLSTHVSAYDTHVNTLW